MDEHSEPPSPAGRTLLALAPVDHEWQPILHVSNQVVLYNPTSHAISIRTHSRPPSPLQVLARSARCPCCHRELSPTSRRRRRSEDSALGDTYDEDEGIERATNRAANYFQLLEIANESSRPPSPTPEAPPQSNAFRSENMAEGYFRAFFQEVCRLGMGANGSVFLCQHVLDGNPLGLFAVKKVAVGQSHSYLLSTLKEVRLLEKLHHPNIVTYHHAWLEPSQFSSFGPKIPTLHILMQWAEGGSLDDLIDTRLGRRTPNLPHFRSTAGSPNGQFAHSQTNSPSTEAESSQPYSRNARIRAFRALQKAPPEERERLRREMGLNGTGSQGSRRSPVNWKPVHLLSAEEIHNLFADVVSGLAFLHDRSILHLDLKPGNVLLTWDEEQLVPRAMLSDFGTSQDMLNARLRSGNTGTLEYSAPESLPEPVTGRLLQVDSKADMWSLGMILHKLLFFRLPYTHTSDNDEPSTPRDGSEYADKLEAEIIAYPGFRSSGTQLAAFESRRLPKAYLLLLETLLHVKPGSRPSSERVLGVIKEGGLDPIRRSARATAATSSLALARPNTTAVRVSPERSRGEADAPLAAATAIEEASDASVEEILDDGDGDGDTSPHTGRGKAAVPGLGLGLDGRKPPALPRPPHPHPYPLWLPVRRWARALDQLPRRVPVPAWLPRGAWTRTLKSCVLVAKVLSLTDACPRGSRVAPLVVSTALLLAIADTCFDELSGTLAFGAAHLALLALARAAGELCI